MHATIEHKKDKRNFLGLFLKEMKELFGVEKIGE
jgi:hypothetical protein